MRFALVVDPNPCRLYRWRDPCPGVYSCSHVCDRPGGHSGRCRCGYCDKRASGRDRSDPLPVHATLNSPADPDPFRALAESVADWHASPDDTAITRAAIDNVRAHATRILNRATPPADAPGRK